MPKRPENKSARKWKAAAKQKGELARWRAAFHGLFVPDRIAEPMRFHRFSTEHHKKGLAINRKFEEALRKGDTVLEIGASTGRLADYFLRRGIVKPENYTMFDLLYKTPRISLKRRIYVAAKRRKLRLMAGNYYTHDFSGEQWNHILMPAALLGRHINRKLSDRETDQDVTNAIKKMLSHVKLKGTLRASHVRLAVMPKLAEFLTSKKQAGEIDFHLTDTGFWHPRRREGIVITKLQEPEGNQ